MRKPLTVLCVAVLCIVVGLMALSPLLGSSESVTGDAGDSLSWLFLIVRILFGLTVWWFWNPVLDWLMTDKNGHRGSEEIINVYQSQRNRFAVLLIVIEIVLVQNVFATLVGWAV